MIVAPLTPAALVHICANMRAMDAAEVFATRYGEDRAELVGQLVAGLSLVAFAACLNADDGEPVAFVALWPLCPGVASINLLATDRWGEIAPAAHRFCLRTVRDTVCASAFRRVECRALAAHSVSRAWLARCGLVEEGVLTALGRNGEDFVQMAWLNPKREEIRR